MEREEEGLKGVGGGLPWGGVVRRDVGAVVRSRKRLLGGKRLGGYWRGLRESRWKRGVFGRVQTSSWNGWVNSHLSWLAGGGRMTGKKQQERGGKDHLQGVGLFTTLVTPRPTPMEKKNTV